MSETKETIDHFALAQALREIALAAGHAILDIYDRDDHGVVRKDDKSPVTDADVAAEKIILEGLKRLTPHIPVVAEEEVAAGRVPDISGPAFWLVDPLDGTKEFINRNGEFTVNIALIEGDQPTLGVVYAPAKKRLFLGWPSQATVEENAGEPGAAPSPIEIREAPESGIKVVASRSHRSDETN
ncbi:MAG: inositol monophosphatase family protein, partial [Alphaproteobacteria bacterium]|nr:inositol monophosphatase family protein [Alphaproteobacteria bacterium]